MDAPDALGSLNARATAALHRWDCRVDDDALHGGMSTVIPVRCSDGSALMLKLLDPEAATREAAALRSFPASASVRCFDHATDLGALLLERLTSTSLATVPIDEQITVQAGLARALAVPAPDGIERLCDVEAWAAHLAELVRDCPGFLNARVVDAAYETIRGLATEATTTLTHGDLHPRNVHKDHAGHWRVIDPNPRVGTIAHESHTVIVERPRLAELVAAGTSELRRRLALFAEVAQVDHGLAVRLCQVRATMSALYGQPRGDTRLAAGLRWMAESLTPLAPG